MVLGVTKRTKIQYLTCVKQAYILNSDVTWSCRPVKKEQSCKSIVANTKMTLKLVLDVTI